MKKILMGACALLALAAVSCDKCGSGKCSTSADSLSIAYGEYVGSMLQSDFTRMDGADKAAKQDFMRGIQLVLAAGENNNTRMGMQVALQMANEMRQLEEQGVALDKDATINAFKQAFMSDSISFTDVQLRAGRFQTLYIEAQDRAAEAKAAANGEETPAMANGKAATEFVDALKAENPDVKTTDSGLSYLIENPGVAPTPDEDATVVVNYTGKLINGTVFDSTDGRGPATFNLQGVVPGFREGLMLIGKGGKATLYIPGNLAYGNNGQPAAGIGPNEMLIFDVELLDINPQ